MAILEGQLRECFGRVVYSHKTHEKCADMLLSRLARIKLWQIILSAITESPQMRVGSGGASSMPPQQRNSIEINAPGEWKP